VDPTYYAATSKTFIGAEFSLFGMRNIADPAGHGTAYPQISAEYILKENPDYVFLADTVCCQQTAATFAKRPGFSTLTAVLLHHVIGVNDSVVSQWGPHTIEEFVSQIESVLRS
jgi:iron complex transport system substrate-binding protein